VRSYNVGVLRANERSATFRVRQFHPGEIAFEFIKDGVNHIWTGLDHILFLCALLLPAALVRDGGAWRPRPGLGAATRETLKVVTAFTLAHSITLCLAFFGVIRLPSRVIEVGIAVSVFAAAWNNLRPFLPGRAWIMAFGFGRPRPGLRRRAGEPRAAVEARGLALGAFNVGVELGQMAIVLAILRSSTWPRGGRGIRAWSWAWARCSSRGRGDLDSQRGFGPALRRPPKETADRSKRGSGRRDDPPEKVRRRPSANAGAAVRWRAAAPRPRARSVPTNSSPGPRSRG
jgi:hypothetical protein